MMKKVLYYSFFLVCVGFFSISISAQNITVSGVVTDASDGLPLPGVNIFTKVHFSGTTTNREGRFTFTLPQRYSGAYLYFSSLGYKTDSIRLDRSNHNVSLKLEPDAFSLSDVIIMPDDALRRLLRDAFQRIPENYPAQPVRYEVFYRQTTRDSTDMIIAVAEAVLDIFKNSYTRPNDPGQVRVVKSRKNMLPQYDSIVPMVGFYGGAYSFVERDPVFTRSSFIHPNHFNRYNYQLTGMTRFDGRDVYIIEFQSRTSELNGRLYIDVQTLAYVRIVWSNPGVIREIRIERERTHYEFNYIQFQGKWHLQHMIYSQLKRFRSNSAIIHTSLENIVLRINTDSANTIPYEERLNFFEPFLEMAQQYDPEFWTGYNILEHEQQALLTIFDTKDVSTAMATTGIRTQTRRERQMQFIRHMNNMYAGVTIDYKPFSSLGGNYVFDYYPQNIIFEHKTAKQRMYFGLGTILGYRLNNHLSTYLSQSIRFSFNSNLYILNNRIGVEYRRNIKPKGHPLFIGGNLEFGWNQYYIDFGDINNDFGVFKVNGRTFDANKLNIRAGFNQFSILPGITVSARVSRLFEIGFFAKYDLALSSRKFVTIREREGFFLTRRSATVSGDYFRVTDSEGETRNDYFTIAPFQLGMVIRFR